MKAIVQRVNSSQVKKDNTIIASIEKGLNVLLGVCEGDTEEDGEILADKILNLRCFEDSENKMNLSLVDVGAEILTVPQFTLCADCTRGRRPSFGNAAAPDIAKELYYYFNECLKEQVSEVETGEFGAYMNVSINNDGPVTFVLDSRDLK